MRRVVNRSSSSEEVSPLRASLRSVLSTETLDEPFVAEERSLKGSYIGSCVPQRDLPRMFSLHLQGKLPVERMLTHRLSLDQINLAMDQLHDGSAIRQVVEFA